MHWLRHLTADVGLLLAMLIIIPLAIACVIGLVLVRTGIFVPLLLGYVIYRLFRYRSKKGLT